MSAYDSDDDYDENADDYEDKLEDDHEDGEHAGRAHPDCDDCRWDGREEWATRALTGAANRVVGLSQEVVKQTARGVTSELKRSTGLRPPQRRRGLWRPRG